MRARYYSPQMHRFVNADIIAGKITEAVTLNTYAYANGNSVSNIDPLGMYSCMACGDAGCGICSDIEMLSGDYPNSNKQGSNNKSIRSKNKNLARFWDDSGPQILSKDILLRLN
jgi:hypothetical protein